MKGKILLVPISSPREGMKCVWKEKKIGIITSNEPVNVDMVEFEGEAVGEEGFNMIDNGETSHSLLSKFLSILSPTPIKVEIEMEDVLDHMDMKIGETPKVNNGYVIVNKWIYE